MSQPAPMGPNRPASSQTQCIDFQSQTGQLQLLCPAAQLIHAQLTIDIILVQQSTIWQFWRTAYVSAQPSRPFAKV